MEFLGCDGSLTVSSDGAMSCSGSFRAVQSHELAASANSLSSADFSVIAGYFVLWFVLAFGVKMIRRVFNI